jgi:hypothetical protein
MHAVLATAVGLTIVASAGVFGTHGARADAALVATPPTVHSSATILA